MIENFQEFFHRAGDGKIYGHTDDNFVPMVRIVNQQLGVAADARVSYPGSTAHAGVAPVYGRDNTPRKLIQMTLPSMY